MIDSTRFSDYTGDSLHSLQRMWTDVHSHLPSQKWEINWKWNVRQDWVGGGGGMMSHLRIDNTCVRVFDWVLLCLGIGQNEVNLVALQPSNNQYSVDLRMVLVWGLMGVMGGRLWNGLLCLTESNQLHRNSITVFLVKVKCHWIIQENLIYWLEFQATSDTHAASWLLWNVAVCSPSINTFTFGSG